MPLSMTAFANIQKEGEKGNFSWEIRSLNHRYLDISFRLPEAFRSLEAHLRGRVTQKIQRGRIECYLKISPSSVMDSILTFNENLLIKFLELGQNLASQYPIANDLSLASLINIPNVFAIQETQSPEAIEEITNAFEETLEQLLTVRAREGEVLKAYLLTQINQVEQSVGCLREQAKQNPSLLYDKLLTRLNSLKLEVQRDRLEQEIAVLLVKMDYVEELDRLQAHCVEVKRLLTSQQSMGKRLDFLMQELNREANTLGSKCEAVEVTHQVVQMKVNIEQMREQIQNLE